jgi:serine/threonine protein kinase
VTPGLTIGSRFGGYRVDSFVARGGMGMIYKATQLALDRTVALKIVVPELAPDEAFRARFKREAQLAGTLDHPNILPVYEAGEIDGQLFLAMRFVVGTDLQTLIAREHALSPERATAIIVQVASALDAAHSRGLVHRDVKPANILIAAEYGEERAYLTDFGLTKNVAASAQLTRTGQMVGTLDYVAPEQLEGGVVDGRVDTYALACVLFVAVTGRVPFDRPTDAAKLWAHVNDPRPSAAEASPSVSGGLDAVIRRGMATRREDRYESSGAFARAARAAAGAGVSTHSAPTEITPSPIGATVVAPPPSEDPGPAGAQRSADGGPPRQGFLSQRRWIVYPAGALLVLAVGAIIAIAAGGGASSPSSTTRASSPPASTSSPLSPPTTTQSTTGEPTTSVSTTTSTSEFAAYHARVATIVPRLRRVFNQFPNGRDFGMPSFSRRSLVVAAGLRNIADSLDALAPPPALAVDHEALVTHLREMEQTFQSLAQDSDNRDFNGATRDLNRTKVALAEVNAGVRSVQRSR